MRIGAKLLCMGTKFMARMYDVSYYNAMPIACPLCLRHYGGKVAVSHSA